MKGVEIHTRRFGLVTEANFTDEIGEYLFNTGQYGKVIEKVEVEIDSETPHIKKKLKHGSEKSTGQAN